MPCEDAPCCGCCTPMTERDHQEAADAHREKMEADFYEYDCETEEDREEEANYSAFCDEEDARCDMLCEGYDEH